MRHTLTKVFEFYYTEDYSMRVCFDDGHSSVIDFSPILHGPLFGPLRDLSLFKKARLDLQTGTLVWPNGADFDPDTLYNWPEVVGELSERLKD